MKLTKILLTLLFLTLPLVHGRIFQTLGLDFGLVVSGNFEFTKALYFNVFSSLIFIVFSIEYFLVGGHKLLIGYKEKLWLIGIFCILCVSTYFSVSPFTSLIGDLEKGHTTILFINLIGIYIVLRQVKKPTSLIYALVLSGVLASVLSMKELYYPSFDYGELGNRALGSFGHPNYLSGFLLLILPFICSPFPFPKERIQVWIKTTILLLFFTTIILCKSLIALFLAGLYVLYLIHPGKRYITKNYLFASITLLIIGLLCYIGIYFPEKLHSLISRFYLWQTTASIIFSDIKILIFGAGLETLPYYFNSFKVPEMYVFENFGYTADRPHSFTLNIFYHFGLLGLSIFLYITYLLISLCQREYPQREGLEKQGHKALGISVIILFLLYGVFHYFSISSYVVLMFAISLVLRDTKVQHTGGKIFISIIIFISLLGAFTSIRLYAGEINYTKGEYRNALEMVFHPKYFLKFGETEKTSKLEGIISEKNFKTQITLSDNTSVGCDSLTLAYPSAENYFYCGNILEGEGEINASHDYYESGLDKLPDLWNSDSPYWDQYFIKHTITGNRFFSEKFGDINSILEKLGK